MIWATSSPASLSPSKPSAVSPGKRALLQALLIIVAGAWVFAPALRGDWLWDDTTLIANNVDLRTFAGLWKIWTTTPDWALTSTLFWVEWHLWGSHPIGYHLVSLMLHLCSGFLLWRLLSRLGIGWAWLGGLLFIVHPLAVESVAWISETKNTLSLPLFLLSLLAWLDYDENKNRSNYTVSVLYYLAAMLAKTSVLMLPGVLLLYSWWKRGRLTRQEIKETLPYLAVAFVLGAVTVHFQPAGTTPSSAGVLAIVFYLDKFLWPVDLLPIYPRWPSDPLALIQLVRLPLMALALGGWWVRRKGWSRHAFLGLGFFLLNLLPVLGLIGMSYQSISPVADHFVYLPMLGLVGLTVAGAEQLQKRLAPALRPCGYGAIALGLALLGFQSHNYAGKFLNHESLWTYTLQRNPEAWPALNNLGDVYLQEGRWPEAQAQYEQALRINPDFAVAHSNLGTTLLAMERSAEAIDQYRQAVRLDPDSAEAHYNLGTALAKLSQNADAIAQYREALRLNPSHAKAHNNLANALLKSGQIPEAIAECKEALRLDPDLAAAKVNLAEALALENATPEKK